MFICKTVIYFASAFVASVYLYISCIPCVQSALKIALGQHNMGSTVSIENSSIPRIHSWRGSEKGRV